MTFFKKKLIFLASKVSGMCQKHQPMVASQGIARKTPPSTIFWEKQGGGVFLGHGLFLTKVPKNFSASRKTRGGVFLRGGLSSDTL